MNTFIKRYTDVPLILRIVIGMVIGIALALAAPGISWIGTLGSLFTTALKAIAPILVFFLVIGALCTARSAGNMKTVICLYIVSTLVAGALAVVASYLFPSELVLTGVDAADATGAPQELSSVIVALLTNALSNPVDALASANYLGELLEWTGYAILLSNPAAWMFVWWTAANLVPRAHAINRKYREEFGTEAVGRRKRIIPFIY